MLILEHVHELWNEGTNRIIKIYLIRHQLHLDQVITLLTVFSQFGKCRSSPGSNVWMRIFEQLNELWNGGLNPVVEFRFASSLAIE
jgi:hypothetical protein